MKICFISHSARLGGAEMVLLETIEVLQESGVQCCAVLPARGRLLAELEKLHVPTLVTSYGLWVSPDTISLTGRARALLNMSARSLLIAWQAQRWDCDILYSNTATVCVGAFAAALLGRPHVWHVHEFGPAMGLKFIYGEKWSHWVMRRLSSLVIAPSQVVAKKLRTWLQGTPCQVVYCSLHPANREHGSIAAVNGKYRCVITGALAANKGQEDAVLAMGELRQKVEAELFIIGEGNGNYGERLRHLVTDNHLEDCVTFMGQLDNPMPQVRAADVVLVCSRAEGFGRVTAEAMVAGKPVIGADNTATAELIQDGVNGLLYRTGNAQELAGKIEYLYLHPEIALRLGQSGQAWAGRMFTRERYRDELLQLLTGVLPCSAWAVAT